MSKITLPKETAAQYELVNEDQLYPQCTFGGWGEVDFESLNVEHAESLIVSGFPYLKRKAAPALKPAVAPSTVARGETPDLND